MSATANPAETVPPLPAPAPPVPAAKKKKKKKRKKRKKPPPSLAAPVMKSRRVARGVTTNFHRITHEIDRVRSDASIDEDTRAQRLDTLTGDLQALGGRTAYQDASIVNTSMFRTSRYVTQVLTRQGVRPKSGSVLPRILEVGAINTQLVNTPWLNTDALDLNSRHPKIQQIDFFEFPCVPGEYDVVVSSMVINCMPTAHQRGALLTKCRRHLRPKGFFFLMLPLLCLKSSPYVRDEDQFRSGVEGVGFKLVEQKMTRKVALFCFQKTEAQHLDAARRCFPDPPRKVKKQGGKKGKRLFSDFASLKTRQLLTMAGMPDMNNLSVEQRQAVMQQIAQNAGQAAMQELLSTASHKCFDKCVTSPGATLSNKEQTCLAMCYDRYVQSIEVVKQGIMDRQNQ